MKAGLHFWWDLVSAAIRATLIYLGSERRFVLLLIEVFCAVVASRASSETMGCHSQSVDVCDSRRFHRLLLGRRRCLWIRTDVEPTEPESTPAIRGVGLEPSSLVQSHPNKFSARPKRCFSPPWQPPTHLCGGSSASRFPGRTLQVTFQTGGAVSTGSLHQRHCPAQRHRLYSF
jgi:hypothetical protein